MREPRNYAYWKSITDDAEKAAEFMVRGSDRQKKELKKAFKYTEYLKKQKISDMFDERRY